MKEKGHPKVAFDGFDDQTTNEQLTTNGVRQAPTTNIRR